MEIRVLRTFYTLSQLKNFTKTGEYLHYAQSHVTTQIQQLEKELGTRLVERMGKSVALTNDGQKFLGYAQEILRLADEAGSLFTKPHTGSITIGASESICLYQLPPIIEHFRRSYPQVELLLRVIDTADFVPLLLDHTIDAALTLGTSTISPNIMSKWQRQEPLTLCSLPTHPLAGQETVTLDDLADLPFILTGPECCYRKLFEADLSRHGLRPKISLETSSIQLIKQMTLCGMGICLLPQIAVSEELANGRLVQLRYSFPYHIVAEFLYHKDKWISPALQDFMEQYGAFNSGNVLSSTAYPDI